MYNPEQHYLKLREVVSAITNDSTLTALLPDILRALHWKGSVGELTAVLKQHACDGPGEIRLILLSLGYRLEDIQVTETPVAETALLAQGEILQLILRDDGETLTTSYGEDIKQIDRPSSFQALHFVEITDPPAKMRSWSRSSLQLYGAKLLMALGLSALLGILGLIIPLFTRHVYDMALPSKSVNTLTHLGLGALLALFFLFAFNWIRMHIVSAVCQSWTTKLALNYGRKFYHLPFLQGLGLSFQSVYSRFKEIDRMRSFFISRSGLSLLDIPFLSITLIAIYFIGGWLVLVPLAAIVTYALVLPAFNSLMTHASALSTQVLGEKSHLELDLARHAQDIKAQSLKYTWLNRYQNINRASVKASRRQTKLSLLMQNTTYVIAQFTSLATMAMGIYLVMDMKLSAGDLIAAMMLARRITSPIQTSAMSLNRISKFKTTLAQIDRFHTLEDERTPAETIFSIADLPITFDNVVFRYNNSADPALAGVTFQTEANRIVAIAGPHNSGKSTVVNILCKCMNVQSGHVLIGKNNLKNMAASHYRDQIAYASEWHPQTESTLLSYLHQLNPTCSEAEITSLCQVHEFTHALEQYDLSLQSPLAHIQDPYIRQYLSMMHLVIKDTALVLMDMNFNDKHDREAELLNRFLDVFRDKKTVFYTTLSAERMQAADTVLVLDQGSVAHFGPTGTKTEVTA